MKKTTILPAFLSLTLVLALSSCQKPARVLLVTGGHDYDTLEFHQLFHQLRGIVTDSLVQPGALETINTSIMQTTGKEKPFDVLVFYDFVTDMAPADSSLYLQLSEAGVPMLFLHHSLCNIQGWSGFQELAGGQYITPNVDVDSSLWSDYAHDVILDVSISRPDHPICQGIPEFRIHDEAYSNLQVSPNATILLETDHPDCHRQIGWTLRSGNSQVVYLIFGHDRHAYESPEFQKLLENSIHWLAEGS